MGVVSSMTAHHLLPDARLSSVAYWDMRMRLGCGIRQSGGEGLFADAVDVGDAVSEARVEYLEPSRHA